LSEGLPLNRLHELAVYRLATIVRVSESSSLWLDVLSFCIIGAAFLMLVRVGKLKIAKPAWPAIALALALTIFVPPALFGVGYVADRMPLFLALTVVGSLASAFSGARFEKLALVAIVGMVAVRIVYVGLDWRSYGDDFAQFERTAGKIPPGKLVEYINPTGSDRLGDKRRCAMYGPLMVALHGQASPLFADSTQQPMSLKGPLAEDVRDLPRGTATTRDASYYSQLLQTIVDKRQFDYALICDPNLLGRPLPAGSAIVTQNGRFTALRLR